MAAEGVVASSAFTVYYDNTMKKVILDALTNMAKRFPAFKSVILLIMAIILAIYHAIKWIWAKRIKIILITGAMIFMLVATELIWDMSDNSQESFKDGGVRIINDMMTIEAQEVDMASFYASEADVIALANKTKEQVTVLNGTDSFVADPASYNGDYIYDEATKTYKTPAFSEDWALILVNKKHLIPEDYEVELGVIRGNIKSDIRIIQNVLDMIQAARDDGVILSVCSPYRDYDRQVMLFNKKAKSYMRRGYSEEEAYELASETVAIPGTSEHQLGLAFDFISNDYTILDAGFAETEAGKWLKEHSYEYGFILRYPKNKTHITEIEFEPWHYRYVGKSAAAEIMQKGLCLEEYVEEIGLIE